MEYNTLLMRAILDQARKHPGSFDQSRWSHCVAGWAIRLSGSNFGLIRDDRPHVDGSEVIEFRTGDVYNTEDIAAHLLGMPIEQARGLFASSTADALDWLSMIVAAHEDVTIDVMEQQVAV